MILRNRRISRNTDTVSLQISFGLPDVKKQLKDYYSVIGCLVCHEQEILYYFSHSLFVQFEQKHADELSKWAFKLALRNHLIIQSANAENIYYLSESLGSRGRGRPSKEEENEPTRAREGRLLI